MTDEEKLAEAYANNYGDGNHLDFGELKINLWPIRRNSFLAGLEAGEKRGFERGMKAKVNTTTISDCPVKPVWHKVADGDLPSMYTTVLDGNGDRVERDEDGKWQAYSEYYERYEEIDPPKVWCELQKYTEE